MNIRLFNDNGCETPNERGQVMCGEIYNAISPLIDACVRDGISLRDLELLIHDEVSISCSQQRLRKGLDERRIKERAA